MHSRVQRIFHTPQHNNRAVKNFPEMIVCVILQGKQALIHTIGHHSICSLNGWVYVEKINHCVELLHMQLWNCF